MFDIFNLFERAVKSLEKIEQHMADLVTLGNKVVIAGQGIENQAKLLVEKAEGIIQQGIGLNRALRGK